MVVGNSRVIQVTNIAPQATKDQMQSLFGFLGKIDDIRLYPTIRDVSCPVQSRICYVKYYDSSTVAVAQHMTNTVFIDRALIIIPVQSGEIPDEHKALEMASNGTLVPGLNAPDPTLPAHVVNTLEGVPPNQVIQTHDTRLAALGLPNYPPLPAAYDARKIEEIRRSVLVIGVGPNVSHQQLIDHFGAAGQVKYLRFCQRDSDAQRYALVEFSDQDSIQKALNLNGSEVDGLPIKVHHATQAISKPQTKSNEAAQREIEEAMCRVKEAQSLISAAIDPVIGMLSKDKRRSRSGSRSRRRSRSRLRRRSRSRSRHRSRRSRSRDHRTRRRSRSRSSRRHSHSRRSRSHGKSSKSKRDRSRNRDKDRDRDKPKKEEKDKGSSPDKESSVEKKRSSSVEPTKEKRKSRSRERKSRDRKHSKSRDKDRKRSRSREKRDKRSRSRGKRRSKSRDRKRSRSRDKKRSRSRDRKRSRSRDRKRSKSRDKKRSHSRDRKRSVSKSKSKRMTKSPSVDLRKKEIREVDTPKVARDYDEEERGFEAEETPQRSATPEVPSKDSPDNMDISNSP